MSATASKEHMIVQLYIMFIFMWQSLFRISDNAISMLLLFMATLFGVISRLFPAKILSQFALPKTLHMAKKNLGAKKDPFTKYTICPKCKCLYSTEDCKVVLPDKTVVSKNCSHVEFPVHPHLTRRRPCGTTLLKSVRTSAGTICLYPRNLFCYKKLTDSLRDLIDCPGFMNQCELWRTRQVISGVYSDVYDGSVWKEFQVYEGVPFLSVPYNFGLCLNVDWFQPFDHSTYSIGVIYIALFNLPRQTRYLPENIILIGVIPGPHEPKLHMNTLLSPLVVELKELWHGLIIQTSGNGAVIIRAALLSVACDIPAARKVSGFVGPQSLLGCSRCLQEFPTASFGDKPDYSHFDRSKWKPRSLKDHREMSTKYLGCSTLRARKAIERSSGLRYSVLSELSYFDPPRMTIVDPMHNLLLGTAKYILGVWKELGFLSSNNFSEIQHLVDSFVAPADIGRIPLKIASGFSDFTADQWRNWIVYYSLPCLKSYLPVQHYNVWLLFVKACHIFCRRTISEVEVEEADKLILQFCKAYVALYGKEYCTPNLHLHGHLASCIKDYGPVYAFWLFSFERLNGILGSYHTNNNDVSLQLMRRFITSHTYSAQNWPEELKADFIPVLKHSYYCKGSLMQETLEGFMEGMDEAGMSPLPPVREIVLSADMKSSLQESLMLVFPDTTLDILMLSKRCKALKMGTFTLGSEKSKYTTSSLTLVNRKDYIQPQLARIQYYLQCAFRTPDSSVHTIWVAAISFFYEHPCHSWFGWPIEVWSTATTPDTFLVPISSIKSRVVYTKNSTVLVISPILSK